LTTRLRWSQRSVINASDQLLRRADENPLCQLFG
jgi:hypothetical protein